MYVTSRRAVASCRACDRLDQGQVTAIQGLRVAAVDRPAEVGRQLACADLLPPGSAS